MLYTYCRALENNPNGFKQADSNRRIQTGGFKQADSNGGFKQADLNRQIQTGGFKQADSDRLIQ